MTSNTDIGERLAARLKETRKERGLSLDAVAKLSGVSRSMLSQIERGESSPTVATLWNLTRALQVDFAGLLDSDASERSPIREVLRADRTPTIVSRGEGCVIRILSSPGQAGKQEVYDVQFEKNGTLVSDPHRAGCAEDLTVLEGRLQVTSGEETVDLGEGDTARYAADRKHAIRAGDAPSRAILVVHDP